MKRIVTVLLIASSSLVAYDNNLNDHTKNTEAIYREGSGSQDGLFTATSISMLGWGIGLAVAIGILAGVIHQSKSSSGHNSCAHTHCH